MSRCLFRQTQCVYPCGIGINDGGKGNFSAIIRFEYSELPVFVYTYIASRVTELSGFFYISKGYMFRKTWKALWRLSVFL